MSEEAVSKPLASKPKREADRTGWIFLLGLLMFLISFLTQREIKYDDDPIETAYSLSLGADCEADIKACSMRANTPMEFRPETTRNEVVEFDYTHATPVAPVLYTGCTIWDSGNWSCEGGKILMSEGVIVRNDLQVDPDIYYVPKIAWKLAKLHVLPVDSVRHAKGPASKPKRSA